MPSTIPASTSFIEGSFSWGYSAFGSVFSAKDPPNKGAFFPNGEELLAACEKRPEDVPFSKSELPVLLPKRPPSYLGKREEPEESPGFGNIDPEVSFYFGNRLAPLENGP
jgi:hypothetical protein